MAPAIRFIPNMNDAAILVKSVTFKWGASQSGLNSLGFIRFMFLQYFSCCLAHIWRESLSFPPSIHAIREIQPCVFSEPLARGLVVRQCGRDLVAETA
jgi:hypothetical protein